MRAQLRTLLTLTEGAELFHTSRDEAYAIVQADQHTETWPVDSREFCEWLTINFYAVTKEVPSKQDVREAVTVVAAKAKFESPEGAVFLRVAENDKRIYLDLGNEAWDVVEIDSSGWRLVAPAPVHFRRPRGMRPLPQPQRGGSVDQLRPYLNLASDADFALLIGYLVSAFCPRGPYPVALLVGEHGTAKSTTARILVSLIDPNAAELRAAPSGVRDLMIAASNSWLLTFDNLSGTPEWLSDGLCRLATGGGFGTRRLYSNAEEMLVEAQRPILLTGIGDLATRGDLLDRSLIFELPPIAPNDRRPETDLWHAFETIRPSALGALLDAVAGALQHRPMVTLSHCPRMADFAVWVSAAEKTIGWAPGTFLAAYEQNHACANETALEASPITAPLYGLLARGPWQGQARNLLRALSVEADEDVTKLRNWPKNPRVLADLLRSLSPNLRTAGIVIQFWRASDRRRTRMIRIANSASAASAASASHGSGAGQHSESAGVDSANISSGSPAPCARSGVIAEEEYEKNLLLDEAANEIRGILQKAKAEGDLRTGVAAVRELCRIAQQRSPAPRGDLSKPPYPNATRPFAEVPDEQLDEFVREHASALGYRAPDESDSVSRDDREAAPVSKKRPS